MKFTKDIELHVDNDYAFWHEWVGFLGFFTEGQREPLTPTLRHVYATALASDYDEPFCNIAFKKVLAKLNTVENPSGRIPNMTYYTLAAYKKLIKKAGWLTDNGKLPKSIADVRNGYRKESEYGIKNISFIFKLCVC